MVENIFKEETKSEETATLIFKKDKEELATCRGCTEPPNELKGPGPTKDPLGAEKHPPYTNNASIDTVENNTAMPDSECGSKGTNVANAVSEAEKVKEKKENKEISNIELQTKQVNHRIRVRTHY